MSSFSDFHSRINERLIQDSIRYTREILKIAEIEDARRPKSRNCPNCGAPIVSWRCEYCETRFSNGPDGCLDDAAVLYLKTYNKLIESEITQQQSMKEIIDRFERAYDIAWEEYK